jgi:hypothetical protein
MDARLAVLIALIGVGAAGIAFTVVCVVYAYILITHHARCLYFHDR